MSQSFILADLYWLKVKVIVFRLILTMKVNFSKGFKTVYKANKKTKTVEHKLRKLLKLVRQLKDSKTSKTLQKSRSKAPVKNVCLKIQSN